MRTDDIKLDLLESVSSTGIDKILASFISSELQKHGIMHNVVGRTKKIHSLHQKMRKEKYLSGQKKIQDLFGVRIKLYFVEDIEICKNLVSNLFDSERKCEWEKIDILENTFQPLKNNCIFKLNDKLSSMINPEIWEYPIDQTFEVQIRTMCFDSWHEIEHDFKYKLKKRDEGTSVWDQDYAFEYARRLNAIVAALELCDKEMENILKEFSLCLYENKKWDEMIRLKFRIRLSGERLDKRYENLLNNNVKLAEKIKKTRKDELLSYIIKSDLNKELLSVNDIVKLIIDA